MATLKQEIENATSKQELLLIAKRLQLRKVPGGISMDMLKQVLLNVVGDGDVYVQPVCTCTHTKKQHFMNNETGEAFECKVPSCDCKNFRPKA